MSWLSFISLATLFACISYVRARRAGERFNVVVFVLFAASSFIVIRSLGTAATFSVCLVFACVCTCAATDISSGYIYDVVTYPSIIALLLASLYMGTFASTMLWMSVSFLAVALIAVATRMRGIGFGDVKLFTVIGAGLGASITEIFGGSFVVGACFIIVALLRKRIRFGQTVAFAPYIAIATILTVPYEALLK